MKDINILATEIANNILSDIKDRGGLSNAWDSIDTELQQEILELWIRKIRISIKPLYTELNRLSFNISPLSLSDEQMIENLKTKYPNLHLVDDKYIKHNHIYVNGVPTKFHKVNCTPKELLEIHTGKQIYVDVQSLPELNVVIV